MKQGATPVFVALAFFGIFVALGLGVSDRPPGALDLAAEALRGQAIAPATLFTALGLWYSIVPIAALAIVVSLALRDHVVAFVILAASQSASQGVVELLKPFFHRVRPPGSVGYHLADFSYPSGHAVTAIVFYLTLTLLIVRSPVLPRAPKIVLAMPPAVCVLGIPWSRLALGAHYFTDVLGGICFGLGWLCLQSVVMQRIAPPRAL
ncbi:MAG TPA: phosphatase PAP2 family protein [Candidatus Baltobacteraceae bacterium]|nr:phosphatase PAP2 family protein [Candidatus Baltobacteraceae bacterium]